MKKSFWNNKVIVITGTSSGIGAALLTTLKDLNSVIFALDIIPTKNKIEGNAEIIQIKCDLSIDKDIEEAKEIILQKAEKIDVLFNNAGITIHGRFDQTRISVFRKAFDINFFGAVNLTLALIEGIKAAKGCIITTSTVSGLYGIPGRSVYSSSKSALHAVFEAVRIELSEFGVRSIIFCPPYTKTNLRTSGLDAEGNQLNEEQHSGKILTSEEVASEMIKAVEDHKSRLVTFDKSGEFVKLMRLFAPALLERFLFKKLYNDFH
jgi:short-subunit dehydrogenase